MSVSRGTSNSGDFIHAEPTPATSLFRSDHLPRGKIWPPQVLNTSWVMMKEEAGVARVAVRLGIVASQEGQPKVDQALAESPLALLFRHC